MERSVAIRKLGKMLGKSLGYRVDPKAPSVDERAEAKQRLPALTEAKQRLAKAIDERRRALLDADPQLQELLAAHKEARKQCEEAFSLTHHFKFTVGVSNGMFFHVKAQGDSWEEIIRKLNGA